MWRSITITLALVFGCLSCGRPVERLSPPVESGGIPVYGYRVVASYPHDERAFTQGLLFHDGYLYESTGLHGRSSVRKVDLETGNVLRRVDLPNRYFGEGLAHVDGRLYQLTWKSETGFIYDVESFSRVGTFEYEGEGWGLTWDGSYFVMSDGSERLRFMDRETFEPVRTVTVRAAGRPVSNLNELAYLKGEIWANVFPGDWIARIDPDTGDVVGWIDLRGILAPGDRAGRQGDVLNGIAYDEEGQRIFVTGKLWPKLYQIELVGPLNAGFGRPGPG